MEYGNHKKHSAGARNVKARAKRALLLPSIYIRQVNDYPISFVSFVFHCKFNN